MEQGTQHKQAYHTGQKKKKIKILSYQTIEPKSKN
jgi:hypothetical protein